MPETDVQNNQNNGQDNSTATANEPQVAGLGKVERLKVSMPTEGQNNQSNEVNNTGADANQAASNGAAGANATPAPPSEEQLKEYFKSQGIEYEGVEKLKEKLNAKAEPTAEETPEQKEAKAKAFDKKRLDLFIAGGGTPEQYVSIKAVAESDVAELSKNALRKELRDSKFSEDEIDAIIKERYYQIDDEEIERLDDETAQEFAKRKKEYGAAKLANRSLHTKTQAQKILEGLNEELQSEDLQRKRELTISANIDEQFKAIPRKDTYEIGEIDGKPIPPISSEVPEAELAEIQTMLKDSTTRNNFLLNQDGTLNLTNIGNVLAENKKLKAALKVSYHEGSTRTNAAWQKTFPARTAHELGIGGTSDKKAGEKGQVASFGKSERVRR